MHVSLPLPLREANNVDFSSLGATGIYFKTPRMDARMGNLFVQSNYYRRLVQDWAAMKNCCLDV
jgi:hypothetical protein